MSHSKSMALVPVESAVEDGREQGVQLGGGLGLQALQRVHLRLQRVQFGHDPALLGERGNGNWNFPKVVKIQFCKPEADFLPLPITTLPAA